MPFEIPIEDLHECGFGSTDQYEIEQLYHVGDVLRVRQWEDMKNEFGMDDDDSIAVPYSFTPEMRWLCGLTFTVKRCYRDPYKFTFQYHPAENYFGFYSFSQEMLEPYEAEEDIGIEGDIFDLFDI